MTPFPQVEREDVPPYVNGQTTWLLTKGWGFDSLRGHH